ncbi:MAG TPA: tetratricopeptide repeat protein [Bauldia sp.]|nr:tetratricopeptide repeat protein [Bauldia sp.]
MSDIFREVDEDLRREQFKRLWDRYGGYVIGLAVLIVVAVGGYKAWEWWETSRAAATGDRFLAALVLSEEGKHDEAVAALEGLAADGSGDYPILATFRSAGEKAAAGDDAGAVEAYDSIAGRSSVPPLVADLARIRAALILADSQSPQELTARIGDLAQTGNPWRQTAREILGLAAFRTNDLAMARKYFEEIVNDQESAQGVRSRAQLMLTLIQSRQGPSPPQEPAEG